MKKRLLSLILLVVTVCCAVFALSACGANSGNVSELQMNKKYISAGSVNADENEQIYYIFYSNGTGKYRCYIKRDWESGIGDYSADYTVTFKYTFVDDDKSAVVCFYDSVAYGENHTKYEVPTNWSRLLMTSKNVVNNADGSSVFCINEDYLKTIPNFGK